MNPLNDQMDAQTESTDLLHPQLVAARLQNEADRPGVPCRAVPCQVDPSRVRASKQVEKISIIRLLEGELLEKPWGAEGHARALKFRVREEG